jgi:hypothetical protein
MEINCIEKGKLDRQCGACALIAFRLKDSIIKLSLSNKPK